MISALILLSTVTQVTVCECIIVYLIIISFDCVTITTGLQFSVTPSPNITTLQSAVFRCTVGVLVPIIWTINETSSADPVFQPYISSYNITYSGAGTSDSTLTIPGDPVLNGTVVQCNAVGKINNELYNEIDSDTLYIQGM